MVPGDKITLPPIADSWTENKDTQNYKDDNSFKHGLILSRKLSGQKRDRLKLPVVYCIAEHSGLVRRGISDLLAQEFQCIDEICHRPTTIN